MSDKELDLDEMKGYLDASKDAIEAFGSSGYDIQDFIKRFEKLIKEVERLLPLAGCYDNMVYWQGKCDKLFDENARLQKEVEGFKSRIDDIGRHR